MFSATNTSLSSGVGKRTRKKFLRKLENGATLGYMSALRNYPEVATGEIKPSVYGEKSEFLGNCRTVLCKEEALRKVIDKDMGEGLVSGPFS